MDKELQDYFASEKPFEMKWLFAIKIWKSPEFTSSSKFNIILKWFTDNLRPELEIKNIIDMLELQCSPGCINEKVKIDFIDKFKEWRGEILESHFEFIEVLKKVLDHEIYQGIFQSNPELYFTIYKRMFNIYKNYLLNDLENNDNSFKNSYFKEIIEQLKTYIRKGSINTIQSNFTKSCLQEIIELVIISNKSSSNCFEEFLILIKILYPNYDNFIFTDIFLKFPTHIKLVLIECSILNFRGDSGFVQKLLNTNLFEDENPKDLILSLSFVLEKLKKYSINLNFSITEKQSAIQYLGDKINDYFHDYYDQYFGDILQLICSTLSLNALILEKNIYNIAAKIIVRKSEGNNINIFMELFLKMVKRLSRTEKFVGHIFKATQSELICQIQHEEIPSKKRRIEDQNEILKLLFNETFAIYNKESEGFYLSTIVASLMSKPSLVFWKSLIFTFNLILDTIKIRVDEKILFQLEFVSLLWCEYFQGTKLYEQFDKFSNEIVKNLDLTINMLKSFGDILLNSEHNNVIMNVFQKTCHNFGNFQLILHYYKPDSLDQIVLPAHSYLSDEEWVLLTQRIINFGKSECRVNNDKIYFQRLISKILVKSNSPKKIAINYTSFSNIDQIKELFKTTENNWILKQLKNDEIHMMCQEIVNDNDISLILNFVEIRNVFEQIVLLEYKEILGAFHCPNENILQKIDLFSNEQENVFIKYINKKHKNSEIKYSKEVLKKTIPTLKMLPIAFCNGNVKIKVMLLHLCLYKNVCAIKDPGLVDEILEMLFDILHFGEKIPLHKYITFKTCMNLVSPTKYPRFYTILFNNLKLDVETGPQYMDTVLDYIRNVDNNNEHYLKLLNLSIDYLSSSFAIKESKQHLEELHTITWNNVEQVFNSNSSDNEANQLFVRSSLPSFYNYFHSFITKLEKNADMDENMRKICKIYIGNSIFYNDPLAIKLMICALNNKTILHFDSDEIECVLQIYWEQVLDALKTNPNANNLDKVVKMVINHRSNEDFLKMLKFYEDNMDESNVQFVCEVFQLILNCNLSTIKGAILHDKFKRICSRIFLDRPRLNENFNLIVTLLGCQISLCKNSKIPISSDTIDDILMFIANLNLNTYLNIEAQSESYFKIHQIISDLSISLIKNRATLLLDRIPQFTNIVCKHLESLCFFKSDRQTDTDLSAEDLNNLKNSFLKLESLMHLIASHGIEFKRVAPYALMFAINLMISNKRSTTLYPKIKSHVENICYDLIKICDHRVGRFILRSSNEASRQVYEVLTIEYNKYHKFKGKV